MSGTIHLTPEEQTTLTNALRLEQAGHTIAAQYLRETIPALRGIAWEDPVPLTHIEWPELFRRHRGSTPPTP